LETVEVKKGDAQFQSAEGKKKLTLLEETKRLNGKKTTEIRGKWVPSQGYSGFYRKKKIGTGRSASRRRSQTEQNKKKIPFLPSPNTENFPPVQRE